MSPVKPPKLHVRLTMSSIIYGYFEIAAKEGDMAGLKGMVLG